MRANSGSGKSKNNNRNPTLRDHERGQGHSGEAITGDKKAARGGKRTEARGKGSP
jgi:hypothetical protein